MINKVFINGTENERGDLPNIRKVIIRIYPYLGKILVVDYSLVQLNYKVDPGYVESQSTRAYMQAIMERGAEERAPWSCSFLGEQWSEHAPILKLGAGAAQQIENLVMPSYYTDYDN